MSLQSDLIKILWVRKVMIRIVLLLFAATGVSTVYACDPQAQIAEQPRHDAWWLRIRFTPCDSEIYGIPVQKIDPSWRLASVMQLKHIPKSALYESGQNDLADGKLHFELEATSIATGVLTGPRSGSMR